MFIKIILLPITFPLSLIYWAVVGIRNFLYDTKVLKSIKPDIDVIAVGNITVGGTGKTPMIEHLIRQHGDENKIAVISRGYGRRTKGFRYVSTDDLPTDCGDEPLQIKRKFPKIVFAVDVDRINAIQQIKTDHPEINLILSDDSFQYRRLDAKTDIVLIDYNRPVWNDWLLPCGRLRDSQRTLSRADYLIISKCPHNINEGTKNNIRQRFRKTHSADKVLFASFVTSLPVPMFPEQPQIDFDQVTAVAGIAAPEPFFNAVKELYPDKAITCLKYTDHHNFTLAEINDWFTSDKTLIITTEKDSMRIAPLVDNNLKPHFYYIAGEVKILSDK